HGEHEGGDGEQSESGHGEPLRSDGIENPPGDRGHQPHHSSPGKKDEPGLHRREVTHVLHVQREHHHPSDHDDEHAHPQYRVECEHGVFEYSELEDRLIQFELTQDEDDQHDRTDDQRQQDLRACPPRVPGRAETEEKTTEPDGRENDRQNVQTRKGLFGDVSEDEVSHDQDDQCDRQHHEEEDPPGEVVDDPPGKAWYNGRGEGDDKTKGTHRRATFVWGKERKKDSLHQRHDHAATGGLEHSADEQKSIGRRQGTDQGSENEKSYRAQKQGARGELLDQKCGDRDHD